MFFSLSLLLLCGFPLCGSYKSRSATELLSSDDTLGELEETLLQRAQSGNKRWEKINGEIVKTPKNINRSPVLSANQSVELKPLQLGSPAQRPVSMQASPLAAVAASKQSPSHAPAVTPKGDVQKK